MLAQAFRRVLYGIRQALTGLSLLMTMLEMNVDVSSVDPAFLPKREAGRLSTLHYGGVAGLFTPPRGGI